MGVFTRLYNQTTSIPFPLVATKSPRGGSRKGLYSFSRGCFKIRGLRVSSVYRFFMCTSKRF